jgi:hypothetical protein
VPLQYYLYVSNELKNNQKYLSFIAQNLSAKIQGSNQLAIGLAEYGKGPSQWSICRQTGFQSVC